MPNDLTTSARREALEHLLTADRMLAAASGTLDAAVDYEFGQLNDGVTYGAPTTSESQAVDIEVARAYGEMRKAAACLGATDTDGFTWLEKWGVQLKEFDAPRGIWKLAPDEHTLRAADRLYTQIRVLHERLR